MHWFYNSLEDWYKTALKMKNLDQIRVKEIYVSLKNNITQLIDIYMKFEKVLLSKTEKFIQNQNDWVDIENKAKGGVNFFFDKINEQIFEPLKQFYSITKGEQGLKKHNEILKNWIEDVEDFLKDLMQVKLLDIPLFNAEKEVKISTKIAKVPTHVITYKMFEEGKDLEQIAKERGLAYSTIIGHLAKFAEQGILDLSKVISEEKRIIFEKTFQEKPQESLTNWKNILPDDFDYHEIRLLWNHYQYLEQNNKEGIA